LTNKFDQGAAIAVKIATQKERQTGGFFGDNGTVAWYALSDAREGLKYANHLRPAKASATIQKANHSSFLEAFPEHGFQRKGRFKTQELQ